MYASSLPHAGAWRWRPSSLRASPSFVAGGVCAPTERRARRGACAVVLALCQRLFDAERMRVPATTAMLLLQRFFMRRPITEHDRSLMAAAAVFVAAKLEEVRRNGRRECAQGGCVRARTSAAAAAAAAAATPLSSSLSAPPRAALRRCTCGRPRCWTRTRR